MLLPFFPPILSRSLCVFISVLKSKHYHASAKFALTHIFRLHTQYIVQCATVTPAALCVNDYGTLCVCVCFTFRKYSTRSITCNYLYMLRYMICMFRNLCITFYSFSSAIVFVWHRSSSSLSSLLVLFLLNVASNVSTTMATTKTNGLEWSTWHICLCVRYGVEDVCLGNCRAERVCLCLYINAQCIDGNSVSS